MIEPVNSHMKFNFGNRPDQRNSNSLTYPISQPFLFPFSFAQFPLIPYLKGYVNGLLIRFNPFFCIATSIKYRIMKRSMKVCVTGACGKIAYSLYSPLCSGTILGADLEIELRLLDISSKRDELRILREELDDCCYNNVSKIEIYDEKDEEKPFTDVDLAIFLGGMARKPGMDRNQVFQINAQIFQRHGRHLDKAAKKSCKCLVIANPTNTNCMVLANNAPSIPKQNFTALTRLDYNRFLGQTAKLFDCKPSQIRNVVLWGNHSRKQYLDVNNVIIEGYSNEYIRQKVKELNLPKLEKIMYERGGFILEKANGNAYLSATKAIIDHLKEWFQGSDRTVSMGIVLSADILGIPAGLCYSLPTRCLGNGDYQIINNFELNEYQLKRICENRDELLKERTIVEEFMLDN